MKRTLAFLGLIALAVVGGCKPDLSGLQVVGVDDLVAWQANGIDPTVCDANGDDTRKRFGVIPGAVLLTSYHEYDTASELPGDKAARLVFYCHSEMCGAGADAARRAVEAGYRDVWVMEPGIVGWAEAGQPVDAAAASGAES